MAARGLLDPDSEATLMAHIGVIPEHMREGLLMYLRHGYAPGHFLTAVLSNDLTEACVRGDAENRAALHHYIGLLYNYAPLESWGSPRLVKEWMERGRAERNKEATTRTDADCEDDLRAIREEAGQ